MTSKLSETQEQVPAEKARKTEILAQWLLHDDELWISEAAEKLRRRHGVYVDLLDTQLG